MNSLVSTSVNRSMRLIYDLYGIKLSNEKIIEGISEMLDTLDNFCHSTALHCIRVSNYSTAMGKRLSLSVKEVKMLWCAALLHDIGKVRIPKEILNKPTKLTNEEYDIVKTHSRKGYEIVRNMGGMEDISNIILYHHEKFDGSGYPVGAEGEDIPLLSRIIAVADAYDSMTSKRPYRMNRSIDSAIDELINGKWTQFDGHIADCFIDLTKDDSFKPKAINLAFGLY